MLRFGMIRKMGLKQPSQEISVQAKVSRRFCASLSFPAPQPSLTKKVSFEGITVTYRAKLVTATGRAFIQPTEQLTSSMIRPHSWSQSCRQGCTMVRIVEHGNHELLLNQIARNQTYRRAPCKPLSTTSWKSSSSIHR